MVPDCTDSSSSINRIANVEFTTDAVKLFQNQSRGLLNMTKLAGVIVFSESHARYLSNINIPFQKLD